MTATATRPAAPPPSGTGRARTPRRDRTLVTSTALTGVGVMLTTAPLRSVYTDWTWLELTVLCSLGYWVPVIALRTRGVVRGWHSLVGVVAAFLLLVWVFVPDHLFAGVIPGPDTFSDVGDLIDQARVIIRDGHTPLESTTPVRMLTAAALVALAVVTDLLGVVLRRPLLAAAPLLEILAVASATSSKATYAWWFAIACIGFLMILLAGTRLQDRSWGPSIDGSAGRLGGARQMALLAVVAALVVPLALPASSVNLLSRWTHHKSNNGTGSGSSITLENFAGLASSLDRGTPVNLFEVQLGVDRPDDPFYVRQTVLDSFNGTGWVQSKADPAAQTPVLFGVDGFPLLPDGTPVSGVGQFTSYHAAFTIDRLGGSNVPIFAIPSRLRGLDGAAQWDTRNGTVSGTALDQGVTYNETVNEPSFSARTLAGLQTMSLPVDTALQRYVDIARQPSSVTKLARQITAGQTTPYAKALAISNYFTDGSHDFVYSTNVPKASKGQTPIESFLEKRQGFCQQYAATAAVLMRLAGLPTRVVIGYTHDAPDQTGSFTVTTADAHAWVEVYFDNAGWLPFDPTPLTGSDATRAVALPYAPHTSRSTAAPTASSATSAGPSLSQKNKDSQQNLTTASDGTVSAAAAPSSLPVRWIVIGVVALVLLILLLLPPVIRRRQRLRRLDEARTHGDPEAPWTELAATALDRGSQWPATVTVTQVPDWLARHGLDAQGRSAVAAVAERVARSRYGAGGSDEPFPADVLARFERELGRWDRSDGANRHWYHRWIPRSVVRRRAKWQR